MRLACTATMTLFEWVKVVGKCARWAWELTSGVVWEMVNVGGTKYKSGGKSICRTRLPRRGCGECQRSRGCGPGATNKQRGSLAGRRRESPEGRPNTGNCTQRVPVNQGLGLRAVSQGKLVTGCDLLCGWRISTGD